MIISLVIFHVESLRTVILALIRLFLYSIFDENARFFLSI
jgi:hypothetical protein